MTFLKPFKDCNAVTAGFGMSNVQKLIAEYQSVQGALLNVKQQRLMVEAELSELKKIKEELEKKGDDVELYKLIGHVFIKTNKKEVLDEVESRMELLEVRLQSLRRQEQELAKKLEELAKELQRFTKAGGG